MSESKSVTSGVAGRYAAALFTLCEEENQLKSLQKDVKSLFELIRESKDFFSFIKSPIYRREQQELVINALAVKIKVLEHTKNSLCLLARKGRLFILSEFINEIRILLENQRGEMSVEVISARALTQPQIVELEKTVSKVLNKKAKVNVQVDKSLIGGLIVKLGSRMIDTTIKSKLVKLQTTMKEVN
ncbi:MAG: ATP synthase F1 subunit delta [Paracoccaceae bacterium]|nr:ATP synthase F1 subunit delta [Paracoccaceae bacterium]